MLIVGGLHKSYGTTQALAGVSLTVRPGEMVGFVGANGAGKSTAMRIVMGLVAGDAGTVEWAGHPVSFTDRQRFGYMPEERGLYPKMRPVEQVAYFGRLHGLPAARARAAAQRLIEETAVVAGPRDMVQALSLGNQQRVQLAAALVSDPELLILDEPFAGLDPIGVDTMAEVLAARCAQGVGVLFSSHQLELVERLCDRVVIIRAGRIVADGTLAELRGPAARQELEVAVDVPGDEWLPPGTRVLRRAGTLRVLALPDPRDDQHVLAAAAAAGRVERFGWRAPSLAELYREAVAAE